MRSATVLSTLVGLAVSSHADNNPAASKIGIPFGVEARSPADFPLTTAAPDNDGIYLKMAGPPHKSCTDGIFCGSHAPSAPILPRQTPCRDMEFCARAVTPVAKLPEEDTNTLDARAWETPCPYEFSGSSLDYTCTNKKEYKTYLREIASLSAAEKADSHLSARTPAVTPAPEHLEAGTNTLDARWFTASCPFQRNGKVAWYPCKYPTNSQEYQEYRSFVGGIQSSGLNLGRTTIKDSLGADFTIAVTLSGSPAKRPTLAPGHRSSDHRPQEHSTLVSFPTTLSVPLEVDDKGHVSVIGHRPTGIRHDIAAHPPASTVVSVRISGSAGVSTMRVQPSQNGVVAVPITKQGRVSTAYIAIPTSKHHHDHESKHHSASTAFVAVPTSKHQHHDHHKSDAAPTFMPVLVSDHGHVSTAFVAVPTSKHHHHDHHKSKHHPSSTTLVPVVIGSHRPVPSSDPHDEHYHSELHKPATTISLHLSISKPSPSCTPLPKTGNVPVSPRNDPVAFVNLPIYTSISNFYSKVPGYKAVFTNRHSRVGSQRHIMQRITMPKYDALACGKKCAELPGCRGFNVFIQRDPAMKLSPTCRSPPHYASAQCWLYNQPVSVLNQRNVASEPLGQQPFRFNRVYAASNGYDMPPTYPNWTGPGSVNGVYAATPGPDPLVKQGRGRFLYQQTFVGELEPAVCINTCDKITAGSRAHGFLSHNFNVKNDTHDGVKGYYRPCNFVNVFQTSQTGGGSFTCSFWSLAPNNPPRLRQEIGGHKVESSYFYNRRYDDIGRFHQEDLIENASHDISGN